MSPKSYHTLGYQGIVASEHEFLENLSQPTHYQKVGKVVAWWLLTRGITE